MPNTNWKLLCPIFMVFLKISPVTFGGGYAMIPVMEREVVEKRKWMRTHEIADILAVSQSVPGAIGVNSAIFIGYRLSGIMGALVAMIGILLPTFCIVVLLSVFFLQMRDHPKVEAAFISIRATIVALIAYAAYKIGKTAMIDKTTVILAGLTVALMFFGHSIIHPVILIVGGAVAGIAIVSIRRRFGLETSLEKEEQVYDYMI